MLRFKEPIKLPKENTRNSKAINVLENHKPTNRGSASSATDVMKLRKGPSHEGCFASKAGHPNKLEVVRLQLEAIPGGIVSKARWLFASYGHDPEVEPLYEELVREGPIGSLQLKGLAEAAVTQSNLTSRIPNLDP